MSKGNEQESMARLKKLMTVMDSMNDHGDFVVVFKRSHSSVFVHTSETHLREDHLSRTIKTPFQPPPSRSHKIHQNEMLHDPVLDGHHAHDGQTSERHRTLSLISSMHRLQFLCRAGQPRRREAVFAAAWPRGAGSAGSGRVAARGAGAAHPVHQVRTDGEKDGRHQGPLQRCVARA